MTDTRCATCGCPLPPEDDPRVVVYCSPWCYAREVAAVPIVHIYPPAREVEATTGIRPACPTCEGPTRETVDMVCQTCGFDYGTTTTGEEPTS